VKIHLTVMCPTTLGKMVVGSLYKMGKRGGRPHLIHGDGRGDEESMGWVGGKGGGGKGHIQSMGEEGVGR
jgi:hypothetical protein